MDSILTILIILSALVIIKTSAREKKSFHMSMQPERDEYLYTLTYLSHTEATVLWNFELRKGENGIISKNDRFTDGVGTSTVRSKTRLTRNGVHITFPMEMTTQMFFIFDLNGELDLPESDITCNHGDNIYYSPGEPVNITVRYSKEGNRTEEQPYLFWEFLGRSGSRANDLTYISSRMSSASRFVEDVSTSSDESFYQTSATVLPDNYEGLLFLETSHLSSGLWTIRRQGFALVQNGHSGPFPPNFMSFLPSDFSGKDKYICPAGSICPITCGAAGPGIKMAELMKVGQLKPLVPRSVERSEWLFNSLYLLRVTFKDNIYYLCTIRNNANRVIRKIIQIVVT